MQCNLWSCLHRHLPNMHAVPAWTLSTRQLLPCSPLPTTTWQLLYSKSAFQSECIWRTLMLRHATQVQSCTLKQGKICTNLLLQHPSSPFCRRQISPINSFSIRFWRARLQLVVIGKYSVVWGLKRSGHRLEGAQPHMKPTRNSCILRRHIINGAESSRTCFLDASRPVIPVSVCNASNVLTVKILYWPCFWESFSVKICKL